MSLALSLGGDRFGLLPMVNMTHGKCVFNEHWLRDPRYAEWITRDRVPGCAKCVSKQMITDLVGLFQNASESTIILHTQIVVGGCWILW